MSDDTWREGIGTHKLNQAGYPKNLAQIHDPPAVIYYRGAKPASWLARPKVGIVGSRKPTAYGRQITSKLSSDLAIQGVVIISGLAFGIDSIAHTAAVEAGGLSVAVLPGPVDKIYPATHHSLAEKLIEAGGSIISEYPTGSEIGRQNFVARNRIISGLCDVLLVSQAASDSGSLHTAHFALDQGRAVMAVPGQVTDPMAAGTNKLIKNGALVVTDTNDVLLALGFSRPRPKRLVKIFGASSQEQLLYGLICRGVVDQEELATVSKLNSASLQSALTGLELAGRIVAQGNGLWSANNLA